MFYKLEHGDCRPVSTPVAIGALAIAEKREGEATVEEKRAYAQLVGSVIYPSCIIRMDTAFAAGLWARFIANPLQA